MSSVDEHIGSIDEALCRNIATLADDRGLLSQNMLSQLRNLVEGVAVRIHANDGTSEHDYDAIVAGLAHIKGQGKLAFLTRFYTLLQPSASHYTFDGDGSERLMLKYYEYLHRVRALLQDRFGMDVLANLEDFPVDRDPSLREYHEKIAERIAAVADHPTSQGVRSRYYVLKTRPFFVGGRIYYEVTFSSPTDHVSKFDRVIAFTDIDISDKYAANLTLFTDSIEVLGQTMPIIVIRGWEVSIRPCELRNFSRIFSPSTSVSTSSTEYRKLMEYLTKTGSSLVELVDLPDDRYEGVKAWATEKSKTPRLFPILDQARRMIQNREPGYVVIRYLMLRLKNVVVREQFNPDGCGRLSGLKLQWGCIPFDQMPFCSSLPRHNPRFWDLMESLDTTDRTHELLARRVRSNVDRRGMLYTPLADLESFGDAGALIAQHNGALYNNARHQARSLDVDRGHVFIRGYEDDTGEISEMVQECAATGVGGWEGAATRWLDERPGLVNDPLKVAALKSLFKDSRVALIYGAAGTGKSTMVNYIASYFNEGRTHHRSPDLDRRERRRIRPRRDRRVQHREQRRSP